jgi:hypothetical protein
MPPGGASALEGNESSSSGVSWAAVIGGAFVAASLGLILLALGTGVGLAVVSPWSNAGVSAATLGVSTIVWMIIVQLVSSAMGGYLAGRLRTRWVSVHTDEVFFRDTAHGFLVWAVGLVLTAAFLSSAAATLVTGMAQGGASAVAGAAQMGAAQMSRMDRTAGARGSQRGVDDYLVDTLLRTNPQGANSSNSTGADEDMARRVEVGRIFARGISQGEFSETDKTYLAQLVTARTGLNQAEAEQRVNDIIAQVKQAEDSARQAADTARKAAAHLSLWTFLALLLGAFCASYAATIGGKQRDRVGT